MRTHLVSKRSASVMMSYKQFVQRALGKQANDNTVESVRMQPSNFYF